MTQDVAALPFQRDLMYAQVINQEKNKHYLKLMDKSSIRIDTESSFLNISKCIP